MDQKILEELENKEGKVRGEKFRTHASFIISKSGEEGLKKIEEELEKLGHPLDLRKAGTFQWHPAFLHPLILILCKEVLEWKDQDIFDMGTSAAKLSFINKVIVRYMVSPKMVFSKSPHIWKSYYNIGELKMISFDSDKRKTSFHLTDFDMHPLVCIYNRGYMIRVIENAIGAKKVNLTEDKCVHKGDSYHEYNVYWE